MRHRTFAIAELLGAIAILVASSAHAADVVPGTDSLVNLHIDGSLVIDKNTPQMWNGDLSIIAGQNWPNPTNPPNAAAWTLDHAQVDGVDNSNDYAKGHTIAAFGYNYLPLETDILARSSSTGSAVGGPTLNSFVDHSTVNGNISLWLMPTLAVDVGQSYNVTVTVKVAGTKLAAVGDAHAFMNDSSRIQPIAGAPSDLTGQYSNVTLPPLNPDLSGTYLVQNTYEFTNVPVGTEFATVTLGSVNGNGLDGLLTSTNGVTSLNIPVTSADSVFDSTMSLSFVVSPEPTGVMLLLVGALLLSLHRGRPCSC